jgi:isochorismate synthase
MESLNNIDTFFERLHKVYNDKLPFVVYRKPNETRISLICQKTTDLYKLKSFDEKGFIFSPFNKNESKIIFPFDVCDTFQSTIKSDFKLVSAISEVKKEIVSGAREQHIAIVQNAIDFINNKRAKKIVLSRKKTVSSNNIQVLEVLKKILNNYKNAFVYLWYHPEIGLWMGATPERLISIENDNLNTMALAGTQKYCGTLNIKWQEKELHEQQFVTDFILDNIKDKIKNLSSEGPFTVKAGSLVHLRTDISGKLKASNLLEDLINSLHPTPAICGIPRIVATDFILKNENYNRSFYTGYLGELNINNSTNLVVNLRCMQIDANKAIIYIGGGITGESNAENEWNETVAKAEIMLGVL